MQQPAGPSVMLAGSVPEDDAWRDFDAHTTTYTGDELLDLFVFLGEPKDDPLPGRVTWRINRAGTP